jgi:conjugative relaxase-like TrwC/TraI family protein
LSTDVVEAVIGVHGGVKFYRGAAKAARAYVERDRSRADDYYLGEGAGVAERLAATPDGVAGAGSMDGDAYQQWVAGIDAETGCKKGRVREDANALRFVEVTVNGPKTWSLAAALHPEVSAALDNAQDKAAAEIVGWIAQHATTRVGPRGRQVQVPVEQIEAAVIRHYTSRAGDPHRHLHLQVNARVFAAGAWRGLHSVGMRDMIEAINGIGHAAVATDPEFRAVLAARGFTWTPGLGRSSSSRRSSGLSALGRLKSTATSTVTKPGGGAIIRVRNRDRGCVRCGTAGHGPMRGRTRSFPPMALTWSPGGTTSYALLATPTPPPPPCSKRPRWAGSTGTGRSTG